MNPSPSVRPSRGPSRSPTSSPSLSPESENSTILGLSPTTLLIIVVALIGIAMVYNYEKKE
jgi:hypothetical protein